MATFTMELGTILDDFKKLYDNSEKIVGEMTRAGAEVVKQNVKTNAPLPEMAEHVKLSVTYKTPTDGGINTKVYLSGYLPFSGNRKVFRRRNRAGGDVYETTKGVPVAFLANLYEYGRSGNSFPDQYKGFFRKSFKKGQIEKAMLEAQKRASGGIIDD